MLLHRNITFHYGLQHLNFGFFLPENLEALPGKMPTQHAGLCPNPAIFKNLMRVLFWMLLHPPVVVTHLFWMFLDNFSWDLFWIYHQVRLVSNAQSQLSRGERDCQPRTFVAINSPLSYFPHGSWKSESREINLVRLWKSRLCERTVGLLTKTTAAFTLFLYIPHRHRATR